MVDFSGIKTGDRVRIVLETEVREVYVGPSTEGNYFDTDENSFRQGQEDIVSVEVIRDPLPTAIGSLVKGSLYTFVKNTEGSWTNLRPLSDGRFTSIDNKGIKRDYENGYFKVIFDAGSVKK